MKKQWLSIVLVLCMVLCLAPATAQAEESKTCELKITVGVNGLTGSAEGATFTFQIKKAINEVTAQYYEYGTMTVTVGADGTTGTNTIAVEEGKYIVQQVGPGDPIGEYVWYSISYTGGNNESGPQSVYGNGNSTEFKVYNTYRPASETNVTTLPITVTGYKAGAKVADAKVTTTEPGIKLALFRFMEKDSAGKWTEVPQTETFKADTEYRVEVYFNKLLGCDYTGLKKENVTVNGVEADAFETTWSGFPYNKDYQVIRGLGKPEVVKTVDHIEITTPPTKTEYMVGEDFDPTGMVVTAHYTDGTTADLSRDKYVIFYGDKLTQGQTDVTIQYNDGSGNSDIKVRQTITVGAYEGPHTHTYGGPWYADAKSHWHQCTDSACPDPSGSTKDLTSHTFVWKVDKAATETQTGLKHEECTVCSYKRSENTVIPALRDYAVTVTCGTATVAAGTPITRAMEGVEVTVTAQAPDGKHFVKWIVKAGGVTLANETSATTTFIMPANDVTIEAEFAENPVEAYTLTVIKGTASVAAGTPITDKIEQNTVVTVTADAPETGKVFDKWVVLEGNVTLTDATKATTTFTMPGNAVKIEATYKDAPPSHTHSYGTDWKYDGTNHWHECECGDKADTAAHSFQWVIDKAATKEATGIKHEECTVCGAKRSENTVIAKLSDSGSTGNTGSGNNNTAKPGKDDSTKSPQTGDSSNLIGWLAALFVSGGVLTVLGVRGKKRKESEAE